MANVLFKRGLLENLPATKVDGTIYITTDEQAMYMDYNAGTEASPDLKRIRIGDTVRVSENWRQFQADTAGNLRARDAIYYIAAENILCAWDGTAWKQINAQKAFNEYVTAFTSSTRNVAASGSNAARVKLTQALMNDATEQASTAVDFINSNTAQFAATTTSNVPGVIVHAEKDTAYFAPAATTDGISVGIKTVGTINGTTVDTSHGPDYGSITITGDGGTKISTTNITGTTGEYTISSARTEFLSYNQQQGTLQGQWVAAASAVESPEESNILMKGSKIKPSIKYGDGLTETATLAWGSDVTGSGNSAVRTVNLEFDLDVYSKSQIDSQLKAVDAMVFKGGKGNVGNTTLPTSGVSIGDTYVAQTAFSANDVQYLPGDLIIATTKPNVVEDANGFIPADGIEWVHVNSGADASATYQFGVNGTARKIFLQMYNNENTYGTLQFDENFALSSTGDGGSRIISINHAAPAMSVPGTAITGTAETALNMTNGTVNTDGRVSITQQVITGLQVNATGHIVGFNTKELTITDTRSGITSITPSARSINASKGSYTHTFNLASGTQLTVTHFLESQSLTIEKPTGTESAGLSVNLTWGSF